MNEDLKFIVENVNKMFGTSYNMISFDSLSNTSLLQVLGDVLVKLGIAEKIDVNNNVNTAIIDILDALLTVKYAPSEDVSPIAFREGISLGKRAIIYPILNWIFSNQEKVLKIKYLSTYMERISVPDEYASDHEMQKLFSQYEQLIDEFWNAYNEHRKVEKQAAEAMELKRDIKKMEADTAKLQELVRKQKEKVSAIPNNASLSVLAKDYHDAVTERAKLEEQLKEQQKLIDSAEIEIKHLREQLDRKRSLQPTSENPLDVIREELHINKILAESKLPSELQACRKELELHTQVANEPEPTQHDLDQLAERTDAISGEIKLLQRKIATSADDDRLGPFRNQAKIIANRKGELSDAVMGLKEENEAMDVRINEKRNTLQAILGGPAMYGNELKQYISNVRDRCNLYKELRSQEQALRNEVAVLTRTFEVLQGLDAGMGAALESEEVVEKVQEGEEEVPEDEVELQRKCKSMVKEIGRKKAEVLEKKERMLALRKEIDAFMKEYTVAKQEFEDATGDQVKTLEQIQTEISILETSIKEQENQYKALQQEIEKNETILQNLSEEMLETAEENRTKPTQIELVKEKLSVQQKLNRELKEELKTINEQKVSKDEQMEILRTIKKFLKCKLEITN